MNKLKIGNTRLNIDFGCDGSEKTYIDETEK